MMKIVNKIVGPEMKRLEALEPTDVFRHDGDLYMRLTWDGSFEMIRAFNLVDHDIEEFGPRIEVEVLEATLTVRRPEAEMMLYCTGPARNKIAGIKVLRHLMGTGLAKAKADIEEATVQSPLLVGTRRDALATYSLEDIAYGMTFFFAMTAGAEG